MSQSSRRKISFHSNLNNSPEKSMSELVSSEVIDSFFPSREGFYKHEDKERLQMTEKDVELYNKIFGKNYLQENRLVKNLLSLPSTTALRSKTQSSVVSQSQRSPLKESPTKEKPKKVPNLLDRPQHKKLLTHLNMFLAKQNNNKKFNRLKRRKSCGCSECGGICPKDFLLDEIQFEKFDQEKEILDPRAAFQRGRRIIKSKTLFSMRSIDLGSRGGLNLQEGEFETRKRVSSLPVIKRELKRTMTLGSEVRQSALSARPRFSQRTRRLTVVKETESTPMSQMALMSEDGLDFPLIMLPHENKKEVSLRHHRDHKTLLIRKKSFDICKKITAAPVHLHFDYNRNKNSEETEKCQTARSGASQGLLFEEKISRITISKRSKTPSSTTRFPSIISLRTEPAEFEPDQIVPLKTLLTTCQTERGGHSKIENFRKRLKVNTGLNPLNLSSSPQKLSMKKIPLKPPGSSKSVERVETTNLRKTSNSFGRLSTQENTERNSSEHVQIQKIYNKTQLYRKSLI